MPYSHVFDTRPRPVLSNAVVVFTSHSFIVIPNNDSPLGNKRDWTAQSLLGLRSIALQHALDQLPQGAPVVLAATLIQPVFIHKQDVVLETGIEMWFQSEMDDDVVVMAVDVGIDTVETLEKLSHCSGEVFGKRHPDAGREDGLVVDVTLYPGHEVLNVVRR